MLFGAVNSALSSTQTICAQCTTVGDIVQLRKNLHSKLCCRKTCKQKTDQSIFRICGDVIRFLWPILEEMSSVSGIVSIDVDIIKVNRM